MPNATSLLASKLLHQAIEDLSAPEQAVLADLAARRHSSKNVNLLQDDQRNFGERLSDRVAQFGGSWAFIIAFFVLLSAWVSINTLLDWANGKAPDPYPFIFLNLVLSMLAAIQAPIIMMSQNRQSAKDRQAAEHDYQVNLKAELEIMQLHDKLDELRLHSITQLLEQQARQLALIESLQRGSDRSPQ